jgi:PDZ domain-containing secreted protein
VREKYFKSLDKLFDNYNPDETVKEVQTKEEVKEQKDLMNHLSQSKAFNVALDFVNKNCDKKFTKEEFKDQVSFSILNFRFQNSGSPSTLGEK